MENPNYDNLLSLYRHINTFNECINSTHGCIDSIFVHNSGWPDLSYVSKSLNEVNSDFVSNIEEWFETTRKNNTSPLLIIPENKYNKLFFKKNHFFEINKWLSMYIRVNREILVDNKFYNIQPVQTHTLSEWLQVVSKSLFNDKIISKSLFTFIMQDKNDLLALYHNDKIIATSLIHYNHSSNNAGIYMVAVDPEYRRQGIGKILMSHTLNHIQKQKIENIYLQSTKEAISLYNSLGFHPTNYIYLLWKIK